MPQIAIAPHVWTVVAGTNVEVRHDAPGNLIVEVGDSGAVWLPRPEQESGLISWELTPGNVPVFWQGQQEPSEVAGYVLAEGRWVAIP